MTMKLHKEVDRKNSESITNFTSFLNRRNRLIGEKMFQRSGARPVGDFYTIVSCSCSIVYFSSIKYCILCSVDVVLSVISVI